MRKVFRLPLSVLATALTFNAAHAATIIRMEAGPQRMPSLMTVENGKARMQSEQDNYILIDPSAGEYLYIMRPEQQIVQMNSAPPKDAGHAAKVTRPPTIKLVHKGAGPKIAGFATQRYQLFANGKLCLNTYLSREALERGQLKDFLDGFFRLQARQKQEYRAGGAQYPACDDAQETLMGRYPELGLAMRTVDPNGQLRQEVVDIQTGVIVKPEAFQPPQGFKKLTNEEFLRLMEGGNPGQAPAGEQAERNVAPAPAAIKSGNS